MNNNSKNNMLKVPKFLDLSPSPNKKQGLNSTVRKTKLLNLDINNTVIGSNKDVCNIKEKYESVIENY